MLLKCQYTMPLPDIGYVGGEGMIKSQEHF